MMTPRERERRAILFERPDAIPMRFHINGSCWNHYPQAALQDLMEAHPYLFPDFERSDEPIRPTFGPKATAGAPHTDEWGCAWETSEDGITGAVVRHPLADWDAFETWTPPPLPELTAEEKAAPDLAARNRAEAEAEGRPLWAGLPHGHTYLLLTYIRGYENLTFDMVDEEPRLWKLIEIVEAHNRALVENGIARGAEVMAYPEDLGMQVGPMLSPDHFRTFIKPSYRRLMEPARDAGCLIHMHSDGDIRDLVDDLVDSGVQSVNLQDLVNGIDWIRDRLKGKVCIDLDIDRQEVTAFGTPAEIDALIRGEVETLGSPEGGLSMIFGLYPGTPLKNVKAVMDAMETYAGYYA